MNTFVPVVPPTPSPRAEELGQRLAETIEGYRRQNPDLSGLDVRQALRLAAARAGDLGAPPRALIALIAGLAVAGLALALATESPRAAGAPLVTAIPVVAVIVGLLLVVVVLRRR
jgi:hypothetical protein